MGLAVTLKDRIKNHIRHQGPLSVHQYMMLALSDPEQGYYKTADPFGSQGDFITAPEISQLFGEMVGIWAVSSWMALGSPSSFVLCEAGPGRGTLMSDILRVITQLAPEMGNAAKIYMVETSQRLTAVQMSTLRNYLGRITWTDSVAKLPQGPMVLIANELLDALPIHQYVIHEGHLKERMVSLDKTGELCFAIAGNDMPLRTTPAALAHFPDGTIIESAPAREAFVEMVATRIAAQSGHALMIDYGALTPGTGDTLQAVSRHQKVGIFEAPGQHDLTSHVDFAALARVSKKCGCIPQAMTQGEFLVGLGLLERAGQLGADKDHAMREKIRIDVERLAAPSQMGTLFKALMINDQPHPSHIFRREQR